MKEKIQKWLGILPDEKIYGYLDKKITSRLDKQVARLRKSDIDRHRDLMKRVETLENN